MFLRKQKRICITQSQNNQNNLGKDGTKMDLSVDGVLSGLSQKSIDSLNQLDKQVAMKLVENAGKIIENKRELALRESLRRDKKLDAINKRLDAQTRVAEKAQLFALIISMTALLGGIGLVFFGEATAGGLIAATGAGLIGAAQLSKMSKQFVDSGKIPVDSDVSQPPSGS